MYRPTTLTTLSVLFLSALAAPMPFGDSLDKRTVHSGRGTSYDPQAGQDACGNLNTDSYPIVAVSSGVYGSGNHCNQGIIVTNIANENAAYARIGDECRECGYDDLKLSKGLFAQISDTTAGVIDINWYFVDW